MRLAKIKKHLLNCSQVFRCQGKELRREWNLLELFIFIKKLLESELRFRIEEDPISNLEREETTEKVKEVNQLLHALEKGELDI